MSYASPCRAKLRINGVHATLRASCCLFSFLYNKHTLLLHVLVLIPWPPESICFMTSPSSLIIYTLLCLLGVVTCWGVLNCVKQCYCKYRRGKEQDKLGSSTLGERLI